MLAGVQGTRARWLLGGVRRCDWVRKGAWLGLWTPCGEGRRSAVSRQREPQQRVGSFARGCSHHVCELSGLWAMANSKLTRFSFLGNPERNSATANTTYGNLLAHRHRLARKNSNLVFPQRTNGRGRFNSSAPKGQKVLDIDKRWYAAPPEAPPLQPMATPWGKPFPKNRPVRASQPARSMSKTESESNGSRAGRPCSRSRCGSHPRP